MAELKFPADCLCMKCNLCATPDDAEFGGCPLVQDNSEIAALKEEIQQVHIDATADLADAAHLTMVTLEALQDRAEASEAKLEEVQAVLDEALPPTTIQSIKASYFGKLLRIRLVIEKGS